MSADTVKVTVREGWAVYDGEQQRGGGETLETDPATAAQWIAAGWVEPAEASTRKR